MKVIIYGSQYGTSKKYAEELGRRTNIEVKNYNDIDNINLYDTIIYFGALYAGGVLGLKKTFRGLASIDDKNLIIATVGLADPSDIENTTTIKRGMAKQVSKDIFEHAHIFHLRGGIDYSCLGFKHKSMMAMLYKKATGLPEERKTAEVKAMIETYNKKVDFIDYNRLDDIIGLIQKYAHVYNPVGRFGEFLIRSNNLSLYMQRLYGAFNASAAANMMCRFKLRRNNR